MKNYNDLVTLINRTAATGGLDVTDAAICDYQDMIGHSSEEQLAELANGKQNETFYRIYGVAYGTIAAIKFYCKHSNKLAEIIEEHDEARLDAEEEAEKQKEAAERWEARYNEQFSRREEAEASGCRLIDENVTLAKELEDERREITELKAKLYDLMTSQAAN